MAIKTVVAIVDLHRINAIRHHRQCEIPTNRWHHRHIVTAIIVDHPRITEDHHHLLMINDTVMNGIHATTTDHMIDTTIDHMIVPMEEDSTEIEIDIDVIFHHKDTREDHDHHHIEAMIESIPIVDQTTRIVVKDIDVRLIC